MTTNSINVTTNGPSLTPSGSMVSANSSNPSNTSTASLLSSVNQFPDDLFKNKEIFLDLFNGCDSVWYQLNDTKRQELVTKFLPKELSNSDRLKTIELLINGSLSRFNFDLLSETFISLKLHKMSPDLVKALEDVKNLKKKLFKIYEQKRQSVLLNEVIEKRRQHFDQSIQTDMISNKSIDYKESEKSSLISETLNLRERVRFRYNKEMEDIRSKSDVSSAEEDTKNNSEKCLFSQMNPMSDKQYYQMLRKHRSKRKARDCDNRYDPSLETQSINLSDIIMRVTNSAITSNSTNSINSDHKTTSISSQSLTNSSIKSSSISTPKKKAKHSNISKNNQTIPSNPMIKVLPKPDLSVIKVEKETIVEKEIGLKSDLNPKINICSDIKEEIIERTVCSVNKPMISRIKSSSSTISQIKEPECPIIAAPLPALPVLIPPTVSISSESSSTSVPPTVALETPPKCFFSLLRDIFMTNATNDRRLSLHKLEELIKEKLRTFSPLVGWSSEMVASAMNYLSGVLPPPHLVPLVDYKEKNQQWQWIGGGRDRDHQLVPLCEQWMKSKDEDPTASLITFSQALPPPAKCLTDWVVRPSSDEEKEVYRKQEAVRYQNPYKAFTFRVHGYESVVGPVKGCGIGAANGHTNSSPNKAREHSLLVSDRPPFVTLLSLVRDAAARLPNGEGTRADICELLKDSQYLLPTISDQQVNGIVSGALDRLHYEKDPCVKYDVNRKVWIYLHRNRTEAEFERLHEVQIAAAKAKRSMSKASRKTNCVPSAQNSQMSQTSGQLSIISKTTQQAIHQAVNNILNSEALKISKTPNETSFSAENPENSLISPSKEVLKTNDEIVSDFKTSLLNKTTKEKQLTPFESFNGSTSGSLSSNSLFVSLQANNHFKSETVSTSSSQFQTIDKKKTIKLKENKAFDSQNSLNIIDNKKQSIIDSSSDSFQPNVNISEEVDAIDSRDLTKLIANDSNSVKSLVKTRNFKQTKPSIKVQIPKTITLPISISQTTLKSQSMITSIVSEKLPALISVTNASNKTSVTSSSITQQTRTLTKIIPGTQVNSTTGTSSAANQMHQISIPTSVLFGARPGSVVLATPTGKSYMMAATGGSIVLQQNSSSTLNSSSSETSTSQTPSLAVRTLQGIRVIPVNTNASTVSKIHTPITAKSNTTNTPVVVSTQAQPFSSSNIPQHHQFVARIITTQTNRGNVPQTQIVIPSSSGLQPLFIAHPSQTSQTSQSIQRQITSTITTAMGQTSTDSEKRSATQSVAPRGSSSQ